MRGYLTLKIKTGGILSKKELNIRYTLADTIEERGIGEVVEEGTGEDYILVAVKAKSVKKAEQKIKPILLSLGLLEATEFGYSDSE
jgi:ketopantoate reductase